MSRRNLRFTDVPRNPVGWGALAVFCCLTAHAVAVQAPTEQIAGWAFAGMLAALQLFRRPVTRILLDDRGLSVRQGRGLRRHFAKADIAALHHVPDAVGPGLLHVELAEGRIEALPLLNLPPRSLLAQVARQQNLPFVAH